MLLASATLAPITGWAQAAPATSAAATPSGPTQVMEKFEVTGSYLPVSSTVTASPVVTLESAEVTAEILDAVDSPWVTCDYDSANWLTLKEAFDPTPAISPLPKRSPIPSA